MVRKTIAIMAALVVLMSGTVMAAPVQTGVGDSIDISTNIENHDSQVSDDDDSDDDDGTDSDVNETDSDDSDDDDDN